MAAAAQRVAAWSSPIASRVPPARPQCVSELINHTKYPLLDRRSTGYAELLHHSRRQLALTGMLKLENLLSNQALQVFLKEEEEIWRTGGSSHVKYSHTTEFNTDLREKGHGIDEAENLEFAEQHVVGYHQLAKHSALKALYHHMPLLQFVSDVMEQELWLSADPMNRLHLNRYTGGDQLGWHHDKSEFFFNLVLQQPEAGGEFEYLHGSSTLPEMVERVLSGDDSMVIKPDLQLGTCVIFRGAENLHRVTPVTGGVPRITCIFNFASEPGGGVLDRQTRHLFFGKAWEREGGAATHLPAMTASDVFYADAYRLRREASSMQPNTLDFLASEAPDLVGDAGPRLRVLSVGPGDGELDFALLRGLSRGGLEGVDFQGLEPNMALREKFAHELERQALVATAAAGGVKVDIAVQDAAFDPAKTAEVHGSKHDVVLLGHVMYYFQDKAEALRAALQCVAPDGRLLIIHQNREGVPLIQDKLLPKLRGTTVDMFSATDIEEILCNDLKEHVESFVKHDIAAHLDLSEVLGGTDNGKAIASFCLEADLREASPEQWSEVQRAFYDGSVKVESPADGQPRQLLSDGVSVFVVWRKAPPAERTTAANGFFVYESSRAVNEYLAFHYAPREHALPYNFGPAEALDFPARIARIAASHARPDRRGLAYDVGCSVGRGTFELTQTFDAVVGVDFSHALIGTANALKNRGKVEYQATVEGVMQKTLMAELPDGVRPEKAEFKQGDACDLGDVGEVDCIVGTNLLCRLPDPVKFLQKAIECIRPGGIFMLVSPYSWMEEYTPKAKWLSGRKDASGTVLDSHDFVQSVLSPHFDLEARTNEAYLLRDHAREFQWGVSDATVWRKK